jgi:hypothetical protein
MSDAPKSEIIQPPNPLRNKVGRLAGFDADAIARAEAALTAMSAQFESWMQDELDKLEASRQAAKAAGFDEASCEHLYTRSHDLKGLGTTYGFPIVTRMAGSLCKLIERPELRRGAGAHGALIEAHVNAIKAAVRDGIKDVDHPVGNAIVTTLEAQVAQRPAA